MSETEQDREIDAAWRAASTEEPRPALDAAIRAEARRAVGSSPADARRRRRQLRYPFAAAATVALLAFGIAQMVPPDQDATIVAEQAAPHQAPSREAPSAREPANAAAPAAREPTRETARAPEAGSVTGKPGPASPPESGTPPGPQASNAMSEPFPATSSGAGANPLANKQSMPASPPPRDGRRDQPPRDVSAEAQTPERAVSASKQRSLAAPAAVAKITEVDETKAKQAGGGSVEAWIARIRELKASGRLDDAATELRKFRAAYGERADALLPRDLR